MRSPIVEFTAHGSPREVSSAIEACAAERRLVTALVVPWESTPDLLNMAVTSTKADGWAIDHTNLGTVTLARLEDGRTRVTLIAFESRTPNGEPRNPGTSEPRNLGTPERGTELLAAFARQIEQRLSAPRPVSERPR